METRKSKYYDTLSEDMKLRYESKIKQCGGIDPYVMKEKELSVNREDFPEITLLDIGNHMIHSVSPYTKRAFKAYKSMEAYSFFESGFVLTLGARKIDDIRILQGKVSLLNMSLSKVNFKIATIKVKHSQKMNAAPHKVWVLAKTDGEIICAHCTCIAGLSETCSHVGALCFAVMSVTESSETVISSNNINPTITNPFLRHPFIDICN